MKNKLTLSLVIIALAAVILLGSCTTTPATPSVSTPGVTVPSVAPTGQGATAGGDQAKPAVEEKVLLDQDGVVITLKSFSMDELFGPSFRVQIDNNTEQSITVQTRDTSVNGVMIETLFSSDIAAGMKANEQITLMQGDLDRAGIETIKDFELKFHVFNPETWDTIFYSEAITISTNADPNYVQEYNDSGTVLLDEKGLKVTIQRINTESSFWGADIYLYIENNTDKIITVQARDVSVNGFMIDPMFSSDVVAGKKAYDTMTFLESDLTDNNITSIDEVTLSLIAFDSGTLDTILETKSQTVTFQQ